MKTKLLAMLSLMVLLTAGSYLSAYAQSSDDGDTLKVTMAQMADIEHKALTPAQSGDITILMTEGTKDLTAMTADDLTLVKATDTNGVPFYLVMTEAETKGASSGSGGTTLDGLTMALVTDTKPAGTAEF